MNEIIMAPYFTRRIGFSQHDSSGGAKPNDFNLIKSWYETVWKLSVNAVIFHNELSNEFIKKYTTKYISFVRYDKVHRPSYNDERFYCYRDYLERNKNINRIICTDLFDVKFLKNPFELFSMGYDLYVGSEEKSHPSSYGWKWVNKKLKEQKLKQLSKDDTMFNAGICGGDRKKFIKLLDMMIEIFEETPSRFNANMPVYNDCLRRLKSWKIFTGFPLHNIFESNKVLKGVYIKHK